MKLRCRGNSLRLRLTQGEVKRLADGERIVESLELDTATVFRYSLGSDRAATATSARLDGATIAVTMPHAEATRWAASDEVGCEAQQGPLSILIEKDFACLKPRVGDEDEDAYPHPLVSDPKSAC